MLDNKKQKDKTFIPRAGMDLYTRKAGVMQDKKSKDKSNQRKQGKNQAKRAMRGEID